MGWRGTEIFRPWVFLCVLFPFMSCKIGSTVADDTLAGGQNLSGRKTLISHGGIFELGFFSKGKADSLRFYLGIWLNRSIVAEQSIVWVANRDKPLSHSSSAVLELSEDGNLVVLDDSSKTRVWTTNLVPQTSNSTEAVLLNDGNFVLRNSSEPSIIYWQSFDHPTDTGLLGSKLGINKRTGEITQLTSWKNSEDPAPGMFSFTIDPNGSRQFFLEWNMSRRYWSTGLWNDGAFSSIPEMSLNEVYNFSFVSNDTGSYFVSVYNETIKPIKLVMDQSGQLRLQTIVEGARNWYPNWARPAESDVFARCGPFGIFNEENPANPCACLQGFKSVSETQLNDQSSGCVRKTPLQCESKFSNGKNDGFLSISNVTFPANSKAYPASDGKSCKSACMQNCSCTAYAYNSSGCSIWEGALLNSQSLDGNNNKQDIHIKLAASELQDSGGSRNVLWVIAIAVPLATIISGFFIWYFYKRKFGKNGTRNPSEDLYLFNFNGGTSVAIDPKTKTRYNVMSAKKHIHLPFFSFVSVSTATGDFSSTNKLGEGGYGPVYRGELLNGQEIAVKRLSKRSGQGLEEFKNETILIAKLQHRNLVKLLGCCIERDENILIYEYMPNKSLDFFLFDSNNRGLLDWKTRIYIIEGIAQGLLYLHQYSRLRIIHRDLKASNILLDAEMTPKISDFGMARMFGSNELQANTSRIVGTYGYMAPEYAMEGRFSIKSDVFSFGVLLLEILSGKRNSDFYHTNYPNLISYAWDLLSADKGLDLLDPILDHPYSSLRYINIGLLCVQDNPTDRPTTMDIVAMLRNDVAPLPTPKQPTFCTNRAVDTSSSSPNQMGTCSVNGLTISMVQAR